MADYIFAALIEVRCTYSLESWLKCISLNSKTKQNEKKWTNEREMKERKNKRKEKEFNKIQYAMPVRVCVCANDAD